MKNLFRLIGVLLTLSVLVPRPSQAQFERNYFPVEFKGPIPDDILQRTEVKTLAEISQDDSGLSESEKKEFFTRTNYALRQAFLTGNVFFNDEISEYLNNIVDHLLYDNPGLRSQIKVYATRFSTPNANCWRNGTIFFNLNLLPYLDNEAEIAYVLAHEITHFQKQHSLKQFERSTDAQQGVFSKGEELDRLFERLKFSRSNELEADSLGFELLTKSDFNIYAAKGALTALREIDVPPVKDPTLDIKALFGVDSIFYDENRVVSYEELEEKAMEIKKKRLEEEEEMYGDDEEEFEYDEEDFSTHPSISDRIERIKNRLDMFIERTDTTGKVYFLQGRERYEYMKDLTRFEGIKKYYESYQYAQSLYLSLVMLHRYPENAYLTEMAIKSFYWISYHSKYYTKNAIMPDAHEYYLYPFGLFLGYMKKCKSRQVRKMARDYSREKISMEAFKNNDKIMFWRARILELVDEKDEAKELYQQILDEHEGSEHYLFVKNLMNAK